MDNNLELFVYMMANEKLVNMLSTIEQTFEFLEEYKVKPDEEVKKVMSPMIERMKKWLEK